MSRVRAPGGALESTDFEDLEPRGWCFFFRHSGDEEDEEPISQGVEGLAQNWSQNGREAVADKSNI